jgi:mycofactocin system transcriptional regulator
MPPGTRPTAAGRPVVTSHDEIERAAFALFDQHGFDGTTLADIAAAIGIGRRTLFRYFDSKNDIPWGRFSESLTDFRRILADLPADLPLWEAVHRGVLAFNDFGPEAAPLHRQRMTLLLRTPALQAHSVHQYSEWRRAIADFVADRLGIAADDLLPRSVGHVSLALSVSAYEQWLEDDDSSLLELIDAAMSGLRTFLETQDS